MPDYVKHRTTMRIVTGIDFSKSTPVLLRRSLEYAAKFGCPLVCMHVVESDRINRYLFASPKSVEEDILKDASKRLALALEGLETLDVEISRVVRVGNPSKLLCAETDASAGDLLILGSHDCGGRHIGPTASRSLRKEDADVLIVRDWHDRAYRKIVVCTDFSAASAHALSRALDLASAGNDSKTEIEIIHVIFPPGRGYYGSEIDVSNMEEPHFNKYVHDMTGRKLDQFCEHFTERLEAFSYSCRVLESEHPAERITEHLGEVEADLVALGTTGADGVLGLLLGSNAERIVNSLPCSVLAVKMRQPEASE